MDTTASFTATASPGCTTTPSEPNSVHEPDASQVLAELVSKTRRLLDELSAAATRFQPPGEQAEFPHPTEPTNDNPPGDDPPELPANAGNPGPECLPQTGDVLWLTVDCLPANLSGDFENNESFRFLVASVRDLHKQPLSLAEFLAIPAETNIARYQLTGEIVSHEINWGMLTAWVDGPCEEGVDKLRVVNLETESQWGQLQLTPFRNDDHWHTVLGVGFAEGLEKRGVDIKELGVIPYDANDGWCGLDPNDTEPESDTVATVEEDESEEEADEAEAEARARRQWFRVQSYACQPVPGDVLWLNGDGVRPATATNGKDAIRARVTRCRDLLADPLTAEEFAAHPDYCFQRFQIEGENAATGQKLLAWVEGPTGNPTCDGEFYLSNVDDSEPGLFDPEIKTDSGGVINSYSKYIDGRDCVLAVLQCDGFDRVHVLSNGDKAFVRKE
jgi:hypothetical protein